ncbi:hypothetical protein [Motiliproteus sp. SC1-56]|uniref:hypothetical protein n=1 Tax=Motiliproteus sp. SC1-56 TaxID=2799565 RepID=UPI001A8BFBCD|nr:hypothetical protein [Motiliproteus sp. SC1-56]
MTIGIMVTVIFIGLISFLFVKSVTNKDTNYRNECVAVGILGTFVGITIGLFNFDSSNVSDSIPAFLDGLKVAFITSGAGMIASVFLSFRKPDSEVSNLEVLVKLQKKNNDVIETALNHLSANATSQIVDSLEQVIGEFNKHIELQLGENFAELNQAFTKLVEWQEKHKDMIDNQYRLMQQQHDISIAKLESFVSIEEERSEALGHQLNEFLNVLNSHASELSAQSKSMKSTIETMNSQSLNITKSLESSVSSVNNKIDKSVKIAESNITALIGVANGKLR